MHSRSSVFAATALILLFASSSSVFAAAASDRAAVEAAAQAWIKSFNARNTDGLASLTTEDVVLLDPDLAPVSGHQAARQSWQQVFNAGPGPVAAATKELVVAGDIAWRIVALTQKTPIGNTSTQCLEIWKRVQGAWKLHRQMSSGLLMPPKLIQQPIPSEPVLDAPRN